MAREPQWGKDRPDAMITRGSESYEDRRRKLAWNQVIPDRFPEAIVNAYSVSDVEAAVQFAMANDLTIAVQSSGHSYVGSAIRDGVLVIDIQR